MRAMLEQAEWMNQHDSLFTSDSVGRALVRYYDHWWHSSDLRLRAYYMLGCAYRDMGNAPRALENFQYAVAQVDTLTAPDSTLNRLMRVHSQMSQIYLLQRLPELEKQELQTAERLAWKTGDTLSALIFEEWQCNSLCNHGEYIECIRKTKELQSEYLKCDYKSEALLSYALLIKCNLAIGNLPQVYSCLEYYESCPFFQTAPERIDGGLSSLYIYKGQYFQRTNQADSAEIYFRKALPYKKIGSNEVLAYKGLYQTFAIHNINDSVLKYIQLYSDAKERSYNNDMGQASIQAKALYDYSIEQQIAKQETIKVARLKIYLMILLFTSFAIIAILFYVRKKKKKELIKLFQKHQTTIQELVETEEELAIVKAKQYADKENINILQSTVTQKEEQIQSLEQTIRMTNLRNQEFGLEGSDIIKYIESLRLQGKRLSPEVCKQLRETVEKKHPTFHEYMNARQQLRENEYLVCLLVVSGFNPSDIEVLMGTSNAFASMTRKRLCVKVFGIEGKPCDFDRLLHRIY